MPNTRLKSIRKKMGLSQQEMADSMHMSQATLSKYENNLLRMNEDLLIRFAEKLGVSPHELIGDEHGNVYFEDGSVNNGNGIGIINTVHYHAVPREWMEHLDAAVKALHTQQELIVNLLQQLTKQ